MMSKLKSPLSNSDAERGRGAGLRRVADAPLLLLALGVIQQSTSRGTNENTCQLWCRLITQ